MLLAYVLIDDLPLLFLFSLDDIEGLELLRWEDQQKIRKYLEGGTTDATDSGSEFSIEVSQTSRATCRNCSQKIKKGEVCRLSFYMLIHSCEVENELGAFILNFKKRKQIMVEGDTMDCHSELEFSLGNYKIMKIMIQPITIELTDRRA